MGTELLAIDIAPISSKYARQRGEINHSEWQHYADAAEVDDNFVSTTA